MCILKCLTVYIVNDPQLLLPVNQDDVHWLVACIDLQQRHIELYDPNVAGSGAAKQIKNVDCIRYILPVVLHVTDFYKYRPELWDSFEPFTCKRINDTAAQQTVS